MCRHLASSKKIIFIGMSWRRRMKFYFPPLKRLLEEYILQSTGEEVNLAENSNARFKAIQENIHVVVSYFDLCT